MQKTNLAALLPVDLYAVQIRRQKNTKYKAIAKSEYFYFFRSVSYLKYKRESYGVETKKESRIKGVFV